MTIGASGQTATRVRRLGAVLLVTVCLVPALGRAQSRLEYQDRGDRFEGVRPRAVTGAALELISALIEHPEVGARRS
jgi:hypothetical protein